MALGPDAMEQRAAKQQRIDDGRAEHLRSLQRISNVRATSQRSLKTVLKELALGGGPHNRDLTDARQARFASIHTTIPLDLVVGDEIWQWPLCHPGHLLTRLVGESRMLQNLFAASLLASPCSKEKPWSLLIGFDEFVPGNKLQLQNHRKSMNLSYSFAELGHTKWSKMQIRHSHSAYKDIL